MKRALSETCARAFRSDFSSFERRERDFFAMILRISRWGGSWLRFSLIRRCDCALTAWLGGSV